MAASRLKKYLDNNHIQYECITHPIAFSALQVSEYCHIKSKHLAKVVICKSGEEMFMVVLPANEKVDLLELEEQIGRPVSLAVEQEFAPHFPDCELGAMPPFGNLYDMDVYVADELATDKSIAFNAGNHSECYKIAWEDYEQAVQPKTFHLKH